MTRYAMVIDLQKCTSCGACAIACKTENNTPNRSKGQTFNWADYIHEEKGRFPNMTFATIPVLCNHCTDAPCVATCPVTPKAMFKTRDGITMHNDERCIGCRRCQRACPYSAQDVDKDKAAYSVISFNDASAEPHGFYRENKELIKGCTASGKEIANKAGSLPPDHNRYSHTDYKSVRRKGIVEKCIFCDHRIKNGDQPYCVASCPAKARIFGDMNDKKSDVSRLIKKYRPLSLKSNKGAFLKNQEKGTRPNVYYVRSFKAQAKKA